MDAQTDGDYDKSGGLNTDMGEFAEASAPRNIGQNPPLLDRKSRSKTSLRMRYEAEVEVIRRKLGSLEMIRQQLGLSQRKLCQLLLVDPSAWSRWVREDEDAPPHIYRMLQWYLAIQEKYPALDVNFWLSTVARAHEPLRNEIREAQYAQIPGKIEALSTQIVELQATTARQRSLISKLMVLSGVAAILAMSLAMAIYLRSS